MNEKEPLFNFINETINAIVRDQISLAEGMEMITQHIKNVVRVAKLKRAGDKQPETPITIKGVEEAKQKIKDMQEKAKADKIDTVEAVHQHMTKSHKGAK